MGYGGYICLVNATKSTWTRSYQHHYQMTTWEFEQEIQPQTCHRIYIEWGSYFFRNEKDDGGEVTYKFNTSSGLKKFQIQARAQPGRMLQVFFEDLSTPGNAKGSTKEIGWIHNGIVNFILVELGDGSYVCTTSNISASWMTDNLNSLRSKTLNQICIPGSHDSGMSEFNGSTYFGYRCNTLTQSESIGTQLTRGIRYFDIRPVIASGKYYTGHYSRIPGGSQGSNGQSIDSIIREINSFTHSKNELIILILSHSFNTDLGNRNYREFNKDEWNGLFEELERIQHLYHNGDSEVNLTDDITLQEFIGSNSSVFMVVKGEHARLGNRSGKGFYLPKNFDVYDKYSGTNDLNTMIRDQIKKMDDKSGTNYFLLSWTLTQSTIQALSCYGGAAYSIRKLASKANQQLAYKLYPRIGDKFPNVIYIDDITDDDAAMMAMAVNQKKVWGQDCRSDD